MPRPSRYVVKAVKVTPIILTRISRGLDLSVRIIDAVLAEVDKQTIPGQTTKGGKT